MTDINDIFSRFWESYLVIPNTRILTQTINIINKISCWAFVYTESNLLRNNYRLDGYIIFRQPQNQNWLEICLDKDGTYLNSDEHPNKYRKRALETVHAFADVDEYMEHLRDKHEGGGVFLRDPPFSTRNPRFVD
jgi:hypothetical protein